MSTTDHTAPKRTESGSTPSESGPRLRKSDQRWGLSWWQAITAGTVAAVVANLVILFIGRAAGASFVVVDGTTLHEVAVTGVILATVPPLVVGTVLATLLAHWWPWVLRLAQIIGGGFALLTVAGPVMADTDGGTQLALALMHVVLAVAVVVSLEAIRRRIRATSAGRSDDLKIGSGEVAAGTE
ncbi:MAG: DUF6069 family protein [Pseudonocardiaceae bacterium]